MLIPRISSILMLCAIFFLGESAESYYKQVIDRHKVFNDDNVKYFISIFTSPSDRMHECIVVSNDDSIQYFREVIDRGYQASGKGKHKEFANAIDTALMAPLDNDINVFIPQTLITRKVDGKWVTKWYNSGNILMWLFRSSVSDK